MAYSVFMAWAMSNDPGEALQDAVDALWQQAKQACDDRFRVVSLEHSSCISMQQEVVRPDFTSRVFGAKPQLRAEEGVLITATLTVETE